MYLRDTNPPSPPFPWCKSPCPFIQQLRGGCALIIGEGHATFWAGPVCGRKEACDFLSAARSLSVPNGVNSPPCGARNLCLTSFLCQHVGLNPCHWKQVRSIMRNTRYHAPYVSCGYMFRVAREIFLNFQIQAPSHTPFARCRTPLS
jgi:hypothetical protein